MEAKFLMLYVRNNLLCDLSVFELLSEYISNKILDILPQSSPKFK